MLLAREGYAELSLKKYSPIAARNDDLKVFNGRRYGPSRVARLPAANVIYITFDWRCRSSADSPGLPRTLTDYHQLRPGHAMGLRPGARGYRRSNANAEPADGGGLAAQVTGSTYDAIGRDHIDPALPVGHEPMGDPPGQLISQARAPSLCGHLFHALMLLEQRKACWLRGFGRSGRCWPRHPAQIRLIRLAATPSKFRRLV